MSRMLACRFSTRLFTTTSTSRTASASTTPGQTPTPGDQPKYGPRQGAPKKAAQNEEEENFDPSQYTWTGKKRENPFHYSDRRSGPGYANFSNSLYIGRWNIWPPYRKSHKWHLRIMLLMLILAAFDWWKVCQILGIDKYVEILFPEAAQIKPSDDIETFEPQHEKHSLESQQKDKDEKPSDSEVEVEVELVEEKPKKKKTGFRDRRIIQYEDRLRLYSNPDKIFRYFATLKIIDPKDESGRTFEVFMTPEDFLRSFTPGVMQPRRWGLDSFKVYQPEKHKIKFSDVDSIFYKLGENGLISYSDYLFLMMLLSTSPNDFALAFKIFDINGDGALDKEEFNKVKQLIMSQTSVGQKHRDHVSATSTFRVETNSALEAYFFGKEGKHKLSAEKFLEFQESLHNDVLKMEFNRRDALDGTDGLISELNFGELLLMHAQINDKCQKAMLKRVKKKFNAKNKTQQGISFDETKDFFRFLYHIDAIDLALHFHRMAGIPIDAAQLKKVARKVTGVNLTDHIIDVVITLFDDNQDGCLSNEEMIAVMRRRLMRGLERPRDTGLFRLVDAVYVCGARALTSMWT